MGTGPENKERRGKVMNDEEKKEYFDIITEKAETLIEALPYIRDFNNKKVVVKYGGSAMLDKNLEESVIKRCV